MLGLCRINVGWWLDASVVFYSLIQSLFFFFNAIPSIQPSTCCFHSHCTPLEFPNDLPSSRPRILLDKISHFKPFGKYIKFVLWLLLGIRFPPLCSAPLQRRLLLTLHWETSCEAWRHRVSFIASSTDLEAPSLVNIWHEGWTICSSFPRKLAIGVSERTERYLDREKSLYASR